MERSRSAAHTDSYWRCPADRQTEPASSAFLSPFHAANCSRMPCCLPIMNQHQYGKPYYQIHSSTLTSLRHIAFSVSSVFLIFSSVFCILSSECEVKACLN